MEASSYGPGAVPGPGPGREADVAPAPAAPAGGLLGWVPADPASLGLAGFAMPTFILGLVNANAISKGDVYIVLALTAYGGLIQLLAGMWAFAERNTFAATAFSSYGAFWISFVLLEQFFAPEGIKASSATAFNHGVAVYLLAWGFFTFYMWIASFRVSIAVNLVFIFLAAAFVILGIGLLGSGHPTITKIGGWVTVATACLAWYTSFAIVLNRTMDRTLLPVFPLTRPISGPGAP